MNLSLSAAASLVAILGVGAFSVAPPVASAAEPSPWWHLTIGSRPANLAPGATGKVVLLASNLGDAFLAADQSPVVLSAQLPPGLEAKSAEAVAGQSNSGGQLPVQRGPVECAVETPHEVKCTFTGTFFTNEHKTLATTTLPPFTPIEVSIGVKAKPEAQAGEEAQFAVSGGEGYLCRKVPAGAGKYEEATCTGLEAGGAFERALSGPVAPASLRRPLAVSPEPAPFGLEDYGLGLEEAGGSTAHQAGAHPFQQTFTVTLNQRLARSNGLIGPQPQPVAQAKDLQIELPPGLIANTTTMPRCSTPELTAAHSSCPEGTAVGVALVMLISPHGPLPYEKVAEPLFNMEPSFGEPARFAFQVSSVTVYIDTSLRSGGDYGVTTTVSNIAQQASLLSSQVTVWGTPGDPVHDISRGLDCITAGLGEFLGNAPNHPCLPSADPHPRPFLSLPTSCAGPLHSNAFVDSWLQPGLFTEPFAADPPMPTLDGCNRVPFSPTVDAKPTAAAATSPTGLDFAINVDDEGLRDPGGLIQSQIKKAVVTLPEGFTTNPSVAEGLHACSQAEYEAASLQAVTGCTPESKIGDVVIESPLVEQKVLGSLYVAKQGENPYGNLLTLYLVARNPELGILIRQALKVTPDPVTGQLTTEVDNVPQLPFSHFQLSFRQGQRSPLITPPACGTYAVKAALYPYSEPSIPLEDESSFQITSGPEGQGCPSGTPPFHPGLEAGTVNNAAGSYSPFYVHMTRKDSEQEITHFSIKLPPGVVGKLAGVQQCSDAAIAAAKAREHEGGGEEELQHPSCPAASEVGHTLVGTGVGNVLAYAPGKVYLAGSYHGSPISIVAITAAKVGPFDLGTVVVREALRVNPETAEVFVDATGSDPIPHIVDGIPVHLRDIRVYVDRPEFVLNPTSCEPTSTASTLLGAGLNFASEEDDNPVTVSSRFQAADCAALGFKPKLSFTLKGGTKRSQYPALKAVVQGRPGDANIAGSEVILPKSEILEQGHIGTSCTRVQFNEGAGNGAGCPANSIYGRARAVTPILSEPLEGPVYLRSNGGERKVPDLVAALHGQEINVDLVGFVDSVLTKNKHGETVSRIRNRFQTVPDAPVTKFTLELFGGKKGLLVNTTNLCARTHKAEVKFTAHNGKLEELTPALKTSCAKKHKGKKHARR